MERSGFWFLLAFSGSSLRYYPQNFNKSSPIIRQFYITFSLSIVRFYFILSIEKIATQLGDISCRKYNISNNSDG